ncbi:MAG TPA: rhamnogalacturonan lyase, partial [Paludibacter sp.]|nr:rhamnogalacturonan lyase [Paludibacter sp.]
MKKNTLFTLFIFLLLPLGSLVAQRQMEKLNRGLVAVRTTASSVFLSWRVLGTDPDNIAFNLYRNGTKINTTPITTATNYTDASSGSTSYTVKAVINGTETGEQNTAAVWATTYLDIPMSVPAAMTMPDATTCTYSPNDCSVGDVDGDGEYEIIVKWEPSNAKDNSQSGYTGDVFLDCYKLNGTKLWRVDLGKNIRAGAHYTDFEVEDFDGDGKAEVACKTAPGTIDGLGNFLSKGPAANDTDASDYRTTGGYILSGPEYLTVFSGMTGAELTTANYNPPRGTVSGWGDSYGNRVDRFLACTAYLDGLHPSIVMCRGYYTRVVLAAWDFKNGALTQRWVYDSNSPNGANAAGQGNHNLSVGDVDDDGKDEIIYGASAFDDNGRCMYATGLGHGDAMHLTDLDPDRKGLEVWEVHESTGAAYGYEMHDPKTGAILWGEFTGSDNGRGLAANITTATRGFEMWSASGPGVSDCKGNTTSTSSPSMNFRIYWDGDLQDELLDGTSVTKYGAGTLLSASGCSSNNSTKSTPNLSADILGDWREEVIFRTDDNTKLRIFTTTIPTTNKLYTLMHDAQYRDAIAWQNAGYNQPPHCGFYMGDDMDTAPVSAIYDNDKRWKTGTAWDNNLTASFTDSLGVASA